MGKLSIRKLYTHLNYHNPKICLVSFICFLGELTFGTNLNISLKIVYSAARSFQLAEQHIRKPKAIKPGHTINKSNQIQDYGTQSKDNMTSRKEYEKNKIIDFCLGKLFVFHKERILENDLFSRTILEFSKRIITIHTLLYVTVWHSVRASFWPTNYYRFINSCNAFMSKFHPSDIQWKPHFILELHPIHWLFVTHSAFECFNVFHL